MAAKQQDIPDNCPWWLVRPNLTFSVLVNSSPACYTPSTAAKLYQPLHVEQQRTLNMERLTCEGGRYLLHERVGSDCEKLDPWKKERENK